MLAGKISFCIEGGYGKLNYEMTVDTATATEETDLSNELQSIEYKPKKIIINHVAVS
jgi:hypothetical protein